MKNKRNSNVYDKQGNEYQLLSRIGEGGQGIVCKTNLNGILVKVLNTKDEDKINTWTKQISWCLKQDFSKLNLALPKIEITKPRRGYVLELMEGLIPLEEVLKTSFNDLIDNESIDAYIQTGGLRRRLTLLLKTAKTLAELHSRGYAYGDISPANIFVSENPKYSEVWFIDCDNICFNEREGGTHYFTQGYGAPEIVRNEQTVNCQTDAWAFSVMAFELLTHQHPFKGYYVEDGDPEIVEQEAYEGKLPWIYDSQDDSNESCGGISMTNITNKKLSSLFSQCFEKGKNNPFKRPSLNQWRDAIQEAHDHLLDCSSCSSSYFYNPKIEDQICPFCSTQIKPEQFTVFEQILFENDDEQVNIVKLNTFRVVSEGGSLSFNSFPYNTELWFESEPTIKLTLEDGNLHLIPEEKSNCKISRSGQDHVITKKQRIPTSRRDSNNPYQLTTWPDEAKADPDYLKLVTSYRWQFV
jgi:serine/threonine protein kinase